MECVALGAAIQAAIIKGDVKDVPAFGCDTLVIGH